MGVALIHKVLQLEVQVGAMKLTIPIFIALLSSLIFAWESYALYGPGSKDDDPLKLRTDKDLLKRWRHERNWWIVLCNLVVWITNWRFGAMLAKRHKESDA